METSNCLCNINNRDRYQYTISNNCDICGKYINNYQLINSKKYYKSLYKISEPDICKTKYGNYKKYAHMKYIFTEYPEICKKYECKCDDIKYKVNTNISWL
jgi:hypothetical protein